MAVSKQPSITPETSSGEGLDEEPTTRASSGGETKWKRFHPFRVVRKIFRRRVKRQGEGEKTSKKSWSTSELQSVRDTQHKYEVSSPPYKIGLSVSHDSIFSSESSNVVGHEELNRPQSSSLSVHHAGVKNMFKDELFSRVHARRDSDDDEEDFGLPHSPCTSPTTADILSQGLKSKPSKSGSLSAGSLISMESSENDEDSAVASSSGNSSRMSLLDRRSLDFEGDPELYQSVPLNHQAAHHKIAVRPKRKHGIPQKRMKQMAAASKGSTLPTTPEVTEDFVKVYLKSKAADSSSIADSYASLSTFIAATLLESSVSHDETSSSKRIRVEQSSDFIKKTHMQFQSSDSGLQSAEERDITNVQMSNQDFNTPINLGVFGILRSPCDSGTATEVTHVNKNNLDDMHLNKSIRSSDILNESTSSGYCIKVKENNTSVGDTTIQTTKSDQLNLKDDSQVSISGHDSTAESDSNIKPKIVIKQSDFNFSQRTIQEKATKSNITKDTSITEAITECYNFHTNSREDTESSQNGKTFIGNLINQSLMCSAENKPKQMPSSHSSSKKQLELEIRQEFQQQKAQKKPDTDVNIMPRIFPEEESIMSEKCVLPNSMGNNKNIISHHVPQKTETFNSLSGDKSVSVNEESSTEKYSVKTRVNEANYNMLDTSPNLSSNVSNVTINSVFQNTCSKTEAEDKVTVSVKHMKEQIKSVESRVLESHPTESLTNKTKLSPSVLSASGELNKVDSTKPALKGKNKMATKNSDPAKRVSVEIVPFNQRLKEGKYQPLINQNKNSNTPVKDSSNALVVERNLSERRVNSKNKDVGNNRHSFSGVLSTDIERPVEKKQVAKPAVDNLHCPVQIRIHKSKTYEKENHCEKVKANKDIIKSPSPERVVDVVQTCNENQAKWEVRVHSTSLPRKKSLTSSGLDISSPQQSVKLMMSDSVTADINQDSFLIGDGNDQDDNSPFSNEQLLLKSKENSRKAVKEGSSSTSDDPEPELLRVFARRSIKQKHCDKDKSSEKKETVAATQSPGPKHVLKDVDQPSPSTRPQVAKHLNMPESFVSTLKSPELVKKKSKSFSEKEKTGPHVVTSSKEITLNRRPSLKVMSPQTHEIENFHRRQRVASEPDTKIIVPSLTDNVINNRTQQSNISCENGLNSCHNEHLMTPSSLSMALSNGSSPDASKLKDNNDVLNRDPNAPSWLQLAQQRRELREQRERLLIGSSTNSFLEASGKPSRSSKVWDMVNNFQKLQMT